MTNLKHLSKKFRTIADLIDDLFHEPEKENKVTAAKIVNKYTKKEVVRKRNYKGKHWTQLPENKAKLMKSIRRMHKARYRGGK